MTKQVVSPNYLDRESPKKWLIRTQGQDINTAQAFEAVEAKGVEFTESSEGEGGYGCALVAVCDTAVGSGQAPKKSGNGKRLLFSAWYFSDTHGTGVLTCPCLVLRPDGWMFMYN